MCIKTLKRLDKRLVPFGTLFNYIAAGSVTFLFFKKVPIEDH